MGEEETALRIEVPRLIAATALKKYPFMEQNLHTLAVQEVIDIKPGRKFGDEDITLTIYPRAVGEIQEDYDKWDILETVNNVIGLLAAAAFFEAGKVPEASPLEIVCLRPDWSGEAHFVVDIDLPQSIDYRALSRQVTERMINIARQINIHNETVYADNSIYGEVNDALVHLKQSLHSSFGSSADYHMDAHRVRLSGNNVDYLDQPLVYLAGLITILEAHEFASD